MCFVDFVSAAAASSESDVCVSVSLNKVVLGRQVSSYRFAVFVVAKNTISGLATDELNLAVADAYQICVYHFNFTSAIRTPAHFNGAKRTV